jgi:hypothetical protein
MAKRVVITGATGFIGRALCEYLTPADYEIIALSRPDNPHRLDLPHVQMVNWDAASAAGWVDYADGAYAIINLAGENIGTGSWTAEKKSKILDSRLNAASAVIEAVEQVPHKPQVVIQTSAIGYYGNRGDQILDEQSSSGSGFLADVCQKWEKKSTRFFDLPVRCAIIRVAVVLGPTGGMLSKIVPMFRKYLGGVPGSGRQWISWIHLADLIAAIRFIMETENLHGVFNLAAPNPVPAKDFYHCLGRVLHRPVCLSIPVIALKLLMGQKAKELILTGQRVLPKRLQKAGYEFQFPHIQDALEDILST